MYALVLAGGSGTRLWPYSRSSRPKQFLNVSGGRTMLQETVDRILPIIPPEHVFVATGAVYADLVAEQLPDVPRENILSEPSGRGTAPCIGLAALHIQQRDPGAVMAVLSADHRVEKPELFFSILTAGEQLADQGYLVTLGITPDAPSTGYGYIKQGEQLESASAHAGYRVAAFVEKPDLERARSYVASGDYVWNAGMFVWRVATVLDAYREHLPNTAKAIDALVDATGSPRYESVLAEVWEETDKTTIDYGIIEKAPNVAVVPADIGWHDVGSWARLAGIVSRSENWSTDGHVAVASEGNYAWAPGKTVAFVGVEGLVVVDTPDALLITSKDRSEEVKEVVDRLRREDREDLL